MVTEIAQIEIGDEIVALVRDRGHQADEPGGDSDRRDLLLVLLRRRIFLIFLLVFLLIGRSRRRGVLLSRRGGQKYGEQNYKREGPEEVSHG